MEYADALVIGGGAAGLAVSHELAREGVEHVVLERGRIGQSWRDRWSSFCLVTPNWSVQLPGGTYDGSDPDGFMARDELVAFLARYASRSGTRSIRRHLRDHRCISTRGWSSFFLLAEMILTSHRASTCGDRHTACSILG